MNQLTQARSSYSQQFLPVKRNRGRPRKDPSLKRLAIAPIPPGFRVKENKFLQAGKTDATDGMVGQAVTGVIEASFDGGYLLTVRIGDSNTSLRGVVFKPGEFIPVTAGNDVAPEVKRIKRNEVHFPINNQRQSLSGSGERSESNGTSHLKQAPRFLPQSTALVACKGKKFSPTGSSSHLSGRGTLVPVVLQPISLLNGSSSAHQAPSANRALPSSSTHQAPSANRALPEPSISRNKDVATAEPLAVVMPEVSSSSQFLTAKNKQLPSPQAFSQTPAASMQISKGVSHASSLEVHGKKETEGLKQAGAPAAVGKMTEMQGTSGSLKRHVNNSYFAAPASHMHLDQGVSDVHSRYAPFSLTNYGTGRMSKLLQAVQENVKPLAVAGVGAESRGLQNPN